MTFKPIFDQDTDERTEMRASLITSFERIMHLADDRSDTARNEADAVVNAAQIVQTILKHGDITPEEHENFSTKLKSVFDRFAKRSITKDYRVRPICSAPAINAIYDTLHALDDYGKQKNRFGAHKPIT
jgi:hypothetical protein|tara:strand:+ start:215815 stop:216201 length:387 start_codon:yes stop_codon:yes gene_type:complete